MVMVVLSLKLLGDFEVRDCNGALLSLPTRKTRGLLSYLAVNEGRPQPRERLMALLWGDRGDRQARHSLSQSLLSIRKLGNDADTPLLDSDGERVTLRDDAFDIDLVRFQEAVIDDPLDVADLYTGPFLDGLYIPEPAFEEWLIAVRADIHKRACEALGRAVDAMAGTGDTHRAIDLARRLVGLDPLREDGHRRLMQLLHDGGDRAGALRQYHACADVLKSDLQVEPDAATKALFHAIQNNGSLPTASVSNERKGASSPRDSYLAIPDRPSIAVLPFQTIAGDSEQNYLGDGVVEAITATLSRIRSFFVISRNSAFTFKGRSVNVVQIGRELGVAYVLEGSVQRADQQIRITVQLVETEAGGHIWADRYDGTIDEIFDLQDRITERVAGALQPSIRQAEIERVRRKRPEDQNAYDYTMRAMARVWALERGECDRALQLLDNALGADPNYPLALSLSGWCHAQRVVYNWTGDIACSQVKAQQLAERAAALSGDEPLVLTVLGAVHSILRNYGTARVLLERAVTLDPNAAWTWQRLGWLETYSDRPAHAIENFERALRLSPVDPMNFNVYAGLGSAKEVARQYDEAIINYRRALEERPNAHWIYRHLTSALSGAGRTAEATEAYAKLIGIYPDLTVAKLRAALVYSEPMLDRIIANLKAVGLPD